MTLHMTVITPNLVLVSSDRLIVTSTGFKELDDDKYKHLILSTDDAIAVIYFTGFAGVVKPNNHVENTTTDWLTQEILNTSNKGRHSIKQHLTDIRDHAQDYIDKLRRCGIPSKDLRLVIEASGWTTRGNFVYTIENCLDSKWKWENEARSSFDVRLKTYDKAKFKKHKAYAFFHGLEALGMRQRALRRVLDAVPVDDRKKIFDISVKIIQAASAKSSGRIGMKCSGIAIPRNEPTIHCLDTRINEPSENIMPNIIYSKSKGSSACINLRIIVEPPAQRSE